MRLAGIATFLLAAPAVAADYEWPIMRVIDGDTVKVDASADMPPELASVRVRLRDVDVPETRRPKCESERRAGEAATAFVKRRIAEAGRVLVRNPAWGKWGGRVIACLILDGQSLSETLIAAGHGRSYDGGKRAGWCS